MARCKLDLESSNTFKTQLKRLSKKFPKWSGTFWHPELQGRVFKYDFGSSDMKKRPSDSFRLIALFFEDPDRMPNQTLYAVMCYHRLNADSGKRGGLRNRLRAYEKL